MNTSKEILYSEIIDVTSDERLQNKSYSTNGGNQMKWLHDGKYIKLDLCGYQSLAEKMVYCLLAYSDIPADKYIAYYTCIIRENGKVLGRGCYSYDFKHGCAEYTFRNIMRHNGVPMSASYDEVIDLIYDITKVNVKDYIDLILYLDSIVRNDDRHFGNFSMLLDSNGIYHTAPIYDNGGACMADIAMYPMDVDFNTNYESIYSNPFSVRFEGQIKPNRLIGIHYDAFIKGMSRIKSVEGTRALEVIKHGLKEMEGITWQRL
jgi:hypothetical protein